MGPSRARTPLTCIVPKHSSLTWDRERISSNRHAQPPNCLLAFLRARMLASSNFSSIPFLLVLFSSTPPRHNYATYTISTLLLSDSVNVVQRLQFPHQFGAYLPVYHPATVLPPYPQTTTQPPPRRHSAHLSRYPKLVSSGGTCSSLPKAKNATRDSPKPTTASSHVCFFSFPC